MRLPLCLDRFWTVLLTLLACAGCNSDVPGSGSIRVSGRLIDAETGQSVSRETFYVHAYVDGTGERVSLDPARGDDFGFRMSQPEIRRLVADKADQYERFEGTFTASGEVLDVDVRLKPTHWVRAHGTVLWRDDKGRLRPLRDGDELVRAARPHIGGRLLHPDADGNYEQLLPRELHELLAINTSYGPVPSEVDLRGVTEEDYPLDVVLEE
ncbi:hypothetical protein Poly30_48010 [Planctomycetes bacterium Poly30]|uniref:Lipoprotein n=1 Tax=Saltatorellus ferox TaxID=2528018 RepID=A0A518EYU5_9BACT|nr:hypothetical protein Poly30_48010 [Planctomycetes bacterium Poly30]